MLTLIVPVLINFLADPNVPQVPPSSNFKKALHEICLQKLMKIGLQYRDVRHLPSIQTQLEIDHISE